MQASIMFCFGHGAARGETSGSSAAKHSSVFNNVPLALSVGLEAAQFY